MSTQNLIIKGLNKQLKKNPNLKKQILEIYQLYMEKAAMQVQEALEHINKELSKT